MFPIFCFFFKKKRVLNPPGGRSNNIFGGNDEPVSAPVNRNKQTNNVLNDNSNINGSGAPEQTTANGRYHIDRNKSNVFGDDNRNQSANKPRRG